MKYKNVFKEPIEENVIVRMQRSNKPLQFLVID